VSECVRARSLCCGFGRHGQGVMTGADDTANRALLPWRGAANGSSTVGRMFERGQKKKLFVLGRNGRDFLFRKTGFTIFDDYGRFLHFQFGLLSTLSRGPFLTTSMRHSLRNPFHFLLWRFSLVMKRLYRKRGPRVSRAMDWFTDGFTDWNGLAFLYLHLLTTLKTLFPIDLFLRV